MFEQFIKAADTYSDGDRRVPAPYIRRSFSLDFVPDDAHIYIACPGFYELYVNGQRITKGYLAPYISNPNDFICYDEYEVSSLLDKGENALGVILGNGFANQSISGWDFDKADFRAPLCVALTLTAAAKDKSFRLDSDKSFKTHPSPIVYDMYRLGTHYDANMEIDGWCDRNFDDKKWKNVSIATAPRGNIVKCTAEPIKLQYEIEPISYRKVKDFCYFRTAYKGGKDEKFSYVQNGYLYDFGVSRAGVIKLKIKGEKGQKITLRHGEKLADDGTFTLNSIFTYNKDKLGNIPYFQTDVYILKGNSLEVYVPSFTYHGFRYVLVEGITDKQANSELLTFEVINSDVRRRSSFNSDNETLNTLYTMTIGADLSNFHYFPTDCPHREKNGWTGDINASREQLLLSFGAKESFKLWLRSLRCAQLDSGMLPGIVPTAGWGYKWGNGPFWDAVAVTLPYTIYKYDLDTNVLIENADMIAKYLRYISSRRDERGLIAIGLGDWVQPRCRKSGILTPLELTDSLTVYDIAVKAEKIFRLLDRRADAEFSHELGNSIRKSIREYLIDKDSLLAKGGTQTSQSMMLYYGMFTDDEYPIAYRRLIEIINKDDMLTCGVIGLCHLFDVLFEGGDADLAVKLITQKDKLSYASMIERGATALCESLDENGLNESENHHFLGDILRVFISLIAGLRVNPALEQKNNFTFSPTVISEVGNVKAEYDFDCGKAICGFRKTNGKVILYATVPQGVTATLKYKNTIKELMPGYNEFLFDI